MTAITNHQIKRIHTASRAAGLSDEARRDLMDRETGQRSSKALTTQQAIHFLTVLNGLPQIKSAGRSKRSKLTGQYAKKIQALWLSAWNLGLIRDSSDKAMIAFVKRQTAMDHINWLRDPKDAAKAIEALKGWIARETWIDWSDNKATLQRLDQWARDQSLPSNQSNQSIAGYDDKIRILIAQTKALEPSSEPAGLTLATLRGLNDPFDLVPSDLNQLMSHYGELIRAQKVNQS